MDFDVAYILIASGLLLVFVVRWNYLNFANPFVSLFIGYFLFIVFGGFYDGFENLYEIDRVVKQHVLSGFIALAAGGLLSYVVVRGCYGVDTSAPIKYPKSGVWQPSRKGEYAALVVLALGWLITILVYSKMSVIPLLAEDVHYARIRELEGKGYFYHTSRNLIYLALSYLTVTRIRRNRSTFLVWVLAVLSFFLLLGYAIRADAMRAIAFPLLIFLVFRIKSPKPWHGAIILAIGSAFFLLNGMLQYIRHLGTDKFFSSLFGGDLVGLLRFAWANVGHRFWVQLENIQIIFANVREAALGGLTYGTDIMVLLPERSETGGVLLKRIAGVDFPGGGITPTIIGETYANFGTFLIIPLCFFLGFMLNLLYGVVKTKLENVPARKFDIMYPLAFLAMFSAYGLAPSTSFGVVVQSLLPLLFSFSIFFAFVWFGQKTRV